MKSVVYLQLLKWNDHPLNGISSLFPLIEFNPRTMIPYSIPITSIYTTYWNTMPTLHHPRSHPIYVIFSADSSTPLSCPDIFHVNLGFSLMTYLRARRMLIVSTHTHNNIHQLRYQYTQHSKQPISLSCWWIRSNTPPFTFTLPQHNPLSTSRWLHYVAHLLHLIWMLCLWTTRG